MKQAIKGWARNEKWMERLERRKEPSSISSQEAVFGERVTSGVKKNTKTDKGVESVQVVLSRNSFPPCPVLSRALCAVHNSLF